MKKKEILEYLKSNKISSLLSEADETRKLYCGEEVFIRGIIAFSNFCVRNCLYCGLRRDNKKIKRYRMQPEEIITCAFKIIEKGIKTIVLQSGDDFYYTREMIGQIIGKIKKKYPKVAITLSIGERPLKEYKAFRDYGADRYLLKTETMNAKLYQRLHPGQNLSARLKILDCLKKLDFQVGAGCIVGLPGQTLDDLVEEILFSKKYHLDMAGIGPFVPQGETPLGNFPSGKLRLTLKILALTRILTKNTHLPATTALATIDPQKGQAAGLRAGCNVIML
ncbi:[FeFe] hydrogenase H-cluster radical SAM maturase HydE, partial [bacterium]|nr:[FeFe] hydrogenase H-cluster radical SAM maturase HydE [bacterium]